MTIESVPFSPCRVSDAAHSPFTSLWASQNSPDDAKAREPLVRVLHALVLVRTVAAIASAVRVRGGETEASEWKKDALELQTFLPVRLRDFRCGSGVRDVEPRIESGALAYERCHITDVDTD